MARELSLFDLGNPEEKIENNLCPIGKCTAKRDEGFGIDMDDDPQCCCKHCWREETGASGTCFDCPIE